HAVGLEAERSAVLPLAQILARLIEALDAPVLAVGDVHHPGRVDLNRMRQHELPGTRARSAPLAHLGAIASVLEDSCVRVAVADEDMPVAGKRDVRRSTEVVGA